MATDTQSRRRYLQRQAVARQARIARKTGGKDLIHPQQEIVEFLADKRVPVMMQHCILKVSQKMTGNQKERYVSAFNICAAVFQKHGYLKRRSMVMTGKGVQRNRLHQREKEASAKKQSFANLSAKLWGEEVGHIKEERKNVK